MDERSVTRPLWLTVVRYVACVPIGIVTSFLLGYVAYAWVYGWLVEDSLLAMLPDWLTTAIVLLVASVLVGAAGTYVSSRIAPARRDTVGFCFTSALLLLVIAGIVGSVRRGTYVNIVALMGLLIGAGLVDWFLVVEEGEQAGANEGLES